MSRKSKKSRSLLELLFIAIYKIFYYLFKGIYLLFKYSYLGIKYLVTKKKEVKVQKVSKGKLKSTPKPRSLKVLKTLSGNFNTFLNKLFTSNSTIGLILGARGTGKSAIGMCLLEQFKDKTNKKIYAMGFNAEDLPDWINVTGSVDDIENGSVLLADESGIEFSSRESMSDKNRFLTKLLLIARHKDLSLMFISQSSANIEINAIRQTDYMLMKPSSLLQKDFERKKIKEIYEEVQKDFDELKNDKGLTYIYSNEYRGFISNELPSFWSQKVSKAYGDFKKKTESVTTNKE